MPKLIPHSVTMRARGFVYNPQARFMTSPWVSAVEMMEKKIAYNKRVDRTVGVLERFVAKWVAQSREARSKARVRAAGEKWRLSVMSSSWANIMETEDAAERARVQSLRDAYEARLVAMPERDLIEYHQQTMSEHRRHHEDYRPWMEFISRIHAKRAALRAAVVDNAQVWVELHNRQRPAQVRRVVVRGRFSALDSSDSE